MPTTVTPQSTAKTTRTVAKAAAPLTSTARKMPAQKAAAKKAPAAKKPAMKPADTKAAKAAAPEKIKTTKKPKLVRDSFTMPKDEYQAIETLKQRATGLQRIAKKSELLRAGIMALSAMDDKDLVAILAKVPALKTGRPMKA
ncbi:hypothetical protein [Limnohabitans sp. Rim8]|uniref:hypothetical protein n=1 Tax=Limnohabitans sp. Rim8 TaxID=1100718 RepID=UPI00261F4B1E|nr:hypothetical protein [Limnohabitans sp. Rim8]